MAPRRSVVPHVHTREDEFSLVISGRIGARVGEEEYEIGPGGLLLKPRGVPHAMWNPTDEPAVLFELTGVESCAAEPVEGLRELGEAHRDWRVGGGGAMPLAPSASLHSSV